MKCLIYIFTLCSIGQGQIEFVNSILTDDYPSKLSLEATSSVEEEETDSYSEDVSKSLEDLEDPNVIINTDYEYQSEEENGESKPVNKETLKLYLQELKAGEPSDLRGQNQHVRQSYVYHDLGRRTGPQALEINMAETPDYLIPEKAPRELVLLVAEESKLLAAKDNHSIAFDTNKILRSGNYWDGVWKEEVIPKTVMRSAPQKKRLGSIKAQINPGTKFYKVVSQMKKISPKLLYIMNKPL